MEPAAGRLIEFPLERRQAQIARERGVEVVNDGGFFGVRLRPDNSLEPLDGLTLLCGYGVEMTATSPFGPVRVIRSLA